MIELMMNIMNDLNNSNQHYENKKLENFMKIGSWRLNKQ